MTTTMTDLTTGKTFVLNDALPGRDAYEDAVALGFVGTRAEWLDSLKGDTGDEGASVVVTTFTDAAAFQAAEPGPLELLVLVDAEA